MKTVLSYGTVLKVYRKSFYTYFYKFCKESIVLVPFVQTVEKMSNKRI